MRFLCRLEAGRALARRLGYLRGELHDVVLLALPRGGIPVGYEVARALGIPLEVMLTRRLEVPGAPSSSLGAVSEAGNVVLNDAAVRDRRVAPEIVSALADAAARDVRHDVAVYRGERPLPRVEGRCVVLVDDGITTGGSSRAAARALRKRGARKIIVAVPVIGPEAIEPVRDEVDELVYLQAPAEFIGVGYWYTRRGLSEDQAVSLLVRARRELGEAVPQHAWVASAGAR
ncbi:MAG TPA: phosphoribosyltransferase family protein [Anaeromyxobacteraceae bacterium]|nr:phosphoribosyltransferase family protein [Anaeromyxobacteraceae bacterium]